MVPMYCRAKRERHSVMVKMSAKQLLFFLGLLFEGSLVVQLVLFLRMGDHQAT